MATAAPPHGAYSVPMLDGYQATIPVNQPYPTTATTDPPIDHVASAEANRLTNALKARKRTKTGCLTCRKRRIKCGEERPTCKNCTKSKRDCEGYLPRVVFKESGPGQPIPLHSPYYPQIYTSADPSAAFGTSPTVSSDGVAFQAIAPRPTLTMPAPPYGAVVPMPEGAWAPGLVQAPNGYAYPRPYQAVPQAQATMYDPHRGYVAHMVHTNPAEDLSNAYAPLDNNLPYQPPQTPTSQNMPQTGGPHHAATWPYSPASTVSHNTQATSVTPISDQVGFTDRLSSSVRQPQSLSQRLADDQPDGSASHLQPFLNESSVGDRYLKPLPGPNPHFTATTEQAQATSQSGQVPTPATSQAHEPEDDWFDVDSEEEVTRVQADDSYSNLGMIIAGNAEQSQGDLRSMTNFLDQPNVLSTYSPSSAASPLKDPKTARIFCHFITATGPTLHVCERHPCNPAVLFTGRPVPKSQQALWSYTLPMLALRHQGLLHAMLALSSLHMAKLSNSSPTSSLRHYHYALRRVAKALGDSKERVDPATLAATLLLGYYEVTTAEHNKWNSHLSGARELISDAPYLKMAKRVDRYHRQKADSFDLRIPEGRQQHVSSQSQSTLGEIPTFTNGRLDKTLISSLMGFDMHGGESGKALDAEQNMADEEDEAETEVSVKDVETYETHLDLFWWYAKQDAYQSILSGNRLLLPFERWARCPPRGPVGKLDAVYGTMDHCFLILARLADFGAKDLPRKKRVSIQAEQAAKMARNSPPSSGKTSPARPPPMYGMIPDPGPVRLPRGFSQEQHDETYSAPSPSDSQSPEAAYQQALAEWTSISQAFDTFYAALGPAYQPLAAEHMTPLSTPFGPSVYFRSYGIACILHLYHTGRMILARVHPKMPPAAMAAALVARNETTSHANAIGRICAGIWPVSNTAPLNPHHGAALMDVCMGLFHSAIQFTDPAQRGWTITKLRDVARFTGWQTSSLIAAGCERAWMHYASIGKGPPYERTMNNVAKDDRVAGRSRDPEHLRSRPKDNNDRRFVKVNPGTRVYWAMGILSVEEDMRELNVDD